MSPPPWDVVRRGARLAGARTYAAFAVCGVLAALAVFGTAPAAGESGGAPVAPPPRILDARCLPSPKRPCAERQWVRPGGKVALGGRFLSGVKSVIFYGAPGPTDDARASARPRGAGLVSTVPDAAQSGPLAVMTRAGVRSPRWNGLVVEHVDSSPVPVSSPGAPSPRRIFYGSLAPATFTFQLPANRPAGTSVTLVRLSDRAVVRTWTPADVPPGTPQRVTWDGKARGHVQPEGLYSFQLSAPGASGSQLQSTGGAQQQPFAFYGHMFPIRGKHRLGGGAGRFGAGRPGHTHQGEDVFAACGTPLVAVRAGSVVYSGYQALAGNYLVIHGSDSNLDYAYMHLRQPALVKTGAQVYTGQPIGEVGQTGDARGCHLHFELWSAPGWYKGGHPFDPLPALQRWDRTS